MGYSQEDIEEASEYILDPDRYLWPVNIAEGEIVKRNEMNKKY